MINTVIPERAILSLNFLNIFIYLPLYIEYYDLILSLLEHQTKSTLTITTKNKFTLTHLSMYHDVPYFAYFKYSFSQLNPKG